MHVALPSRLKGAGTQSLVVRADGIESNKALLTITDGGAPPRPTRIEISPATATISVGGEMRFGARAFCFRVESTRERFLQIGERVSRDGDDSGVLGQLLRDNLIERVGGGVMVVEVITIVLDRTEAGDTELR